VQFENKSKDLSLFQTIDKDLELVAEKLKARLTIDRPWAPKSFHPFEERRIDWEDKGLNKAIIIQPYFAPTGVDSTKWSLINIAWIKKNKISKKPQWERILIENENFIKIENNITELLKRSIDNLESIELKEVEKLTSKRN